VQLNTPSELLYACAFMILSNGLQKWLTSYELCKKRRKKIGAVK